MQAGHMSVNLYIIACLIVCVSVWRGGGACVSVVCKGVWMCACMCVSGSPVLYIRNYLSYTDWAQSTN